MKKELGTTFLGFTNPFGDKEQPPKNNGGEGSPTNHINREPLSNPRQERIEWWINAPEKIIKYEAGDVRDQNGNIIYTYERGSRLLIGDEEKGEAIEVMDTCETPWADLTVRRAFEELGKIDHPVKVLERGFGMGRTATRVIDQLVANYGGSYTVIELNKADAAYANGEWKSDQEGGIQQRSRSRGEPTNGSKVSIRVIEGEAYQETAKLAKQGEKFDIIISDTFPLTKAEEGTNDLGDLETLIHCLNPTGVFTFFAYFPGSTGNMNHEQLSKVVGNFRHYDGGSQAIVNPPPDYKYLNLEGTGPVRSLPVVICKNPIL